MFESSLGVATVLVAAYSIFVLARRDFTPAGVVMGFIAGGAWFAVAFEAQHVSVLVDATTIHITNRPTWYYGALTAGVLMNTYSLYIGMMTWELLPRPKKQGET